MAATRIRRTPRAAVASTSRPHLTLVSQANPDNWKQSLDLDDRIRVLRVGTEADILQAAALEEAYQAGIDSVEEEHEAAVNEAENAKSALVTSLFDALQVALDDYSFERLDAEQFYERVNDIHTVISHIDSRPEFSFEEAAERAGKKIPQA